MMRVAMLLTVLPLAQCESGRELTQDETSTHPQRSTQFGPTAIPVFDSSGSASALQISFYPYNTECFYNSSDPTSLLSSNTYLVGECQSVPSFESDDYGYTQDIILDSSLLFSSITCNEDGTLSAQANFYGTLDCSGTGTPGPPGFFRDGCIAGTGEPGMIRSMKMQCV